MSGDFRVVHVERHLYGIRSRGYSQTLVNAGRDVPGLHFDYAAGAWVGYADAVSVCARLLQAQGHEVADAEELTPDFDPAATITTMPTAEKDLKAHQKAGVKFLLRKMSEGAVLSWEMGCMKTATALTAARALKVPTLVVCPNSVRGVWGDGETSETKRWWRDAWPPRMLSGTKPKPLETFGMKPTYADLGHIHAVDADGRPGPELAVPALTVIHYDILHAWAEHLAGYIQLVIFDEAHALASAKSRRSQAAQLIARSAARGRIALSGTLIPNHVRDLHNIVETISPDRFGWFFAGEPPPNGKRHSFGTRYCNAHREQVTRDKAAWIFDGSSNEEELHYRLSFFTSHVTKSAIAAELPAQTRQVFDVEVSRRNITNPASTIVNGKISQDLFRRALDLAADAKVPHVIELAASAAESASVVVFTYRRLTAERITTALRAQKIDSVYCHGGLSQKERDRRIATKPRVLVATIDTTSVGINLTFASTAIFAELTWEWWELAQAEARLHRPGAKHPVLIQYPLAAGSIDQIIRKRVLSKLRVFEKVVGAAGNNLSTDLDASAGRSTDEILKGLADLILKEGKKS